MGEKRITVRIENSKHQLVKLKALKEKKTMTEIVNDLLDKWLKREK